MAYSIDLSGRIALVTGASSGLGTQFARTLARAGAAVVLASRRTERLKELRAEIEAEGGDAHVVELDVTRVVVAHRLSTIREADRILVIDAGQVVQEGTYAELVQQPGPFRTLVERQAEEPLPTLDVPPIDEVQVGSAP